MVFRVAKTTDYTVMSNAHLRDRKISLKAKGLLCLMLSLPDDWNYTLAGLKKIVVEGMSAIRAAVLELESAGYIRRERLRDEQGKVGSIVYTIYERPQAQSISSPPDSTAKPQVDIPSADMPKFDNPILGKPVLENRAQLNTNESNTKILSTYSYVNPSINQSLPASKAKATPSRMDGRIEDERGRVREQIEYTVLSEEYGEDKLDDIVEIMAEIACCRSGTRRIEKCDYDISVVKARLAELRSSHIQYVMNSFASNQRRVTNIKAYLLTMLFNAAATMTSHYENDYISRFDDE